MLQMTNFTNAAKNAVIIATKKAQNLGYSFVGTQHLIYGLILAKNSMSALILKSTVNLNLFEKQLKLKKQNKINFKLSIKSFSPKLKLILKLACKQSKTIGLSKTGTQQILLELLKHEHCCGLTFLKQTDSLIESNLFAKSLSCNFNILTNLNKKKISKHNKILNQFGKNLTKLAKLKQIDPLIGRTTELNQMEQILTRRKKNNPCLIGEPGVGKTAIVEGLALKIAQNIVPKFLKNKQIISLNLPSILAGTKYRGEFEQRLEAILNEAKKNNKIILFFDEIHNIVNAGAAQGAIDASNILKPSMARGDIQIIGTTTNHEFNKMIECDPALERRLQPILVKEPSFSETFKIILESKVNYEIFHKIKISEQAIKAAITMSKKYFKKRLLPDIAIDLIDEAAAKKKLIHSNSKTILTAFDVANLINEKLN